MQAKLNSTGTVAVDENNVWKSMDSCPIGVKVQLLGKGGVASYGTWDGKDSFWTGWYPLPTGWHPLPKRA